MNATIKKIVEELTEVEKKFTAVTADEAAGLVKIEDLKSKVKEFLTIGGHVKYSIDELEGFVKELNVLIIKAAENKKELTTLATRRTKLQRDFISLLTDEPLKKNFLAPPAPATPVVTEEVAKK